jgi:hypothetical protein
MKVNQKLIEQFMEDSKFQDKLDVYDNEKVEKSLINYIELYQEVYSMEEDELLDVLGRDIYRDKKDILKGLNRGYKFQLKISKRLGINISEYPRSLEDLMK